MNMMCLLVLLCMWTKGLSCFANYIAKWFETNSVDARGASLCLLIMMKTSCGYRAPGPIMDMQALEYM